MPSPNTDLVVAMKETTVGSARYCMAVLPRVSLKSPGDFVCHRRASPWPVESAPGRESEKGDAIEGELLRF
jgi:hypothetical protein